MPASSPTRSPMASTTRHAHYSHHHSAHLLLCVCRFLHVLHVEHCPRNTWQQAQILPYSNTRYETQHSIISVVPLQVVMEGHWPSRKRNWKVLSIVVSTCFYLLRFLRSRNEEREETLGNPDFRILSRTASVSSRKSLSALDVGLEGEESGEEPLSSLQSRKVSGSSQQHTGRVYKLSTATVPGWCIAPRGLYSMYCASLLHDI